MSQKNFPKPPYWTVIFPNQRTRIDAKGYEVMAKRMIELASVQPGCLGFDSARDEQGFGITVSYWDSLEAIKAWRDHPEHKQAQTLGREKWYTQYDLHIACVEHSHFFENSS